MREYDPYSYEIDEDPYPTYKWMRDEEPAYHNERLGFWAFTRFDDCLEALIDWRTYSSACGTVLELMETEIGGPLIIFMDPPRQTRLRNLVSKAFTPRRIAALEPRIREIAVEHLDPLVGAGSCDVVRDFTAKLPMDVISTMLGIPREDRDMVRGWSNDVLHRDPDNPLVSPRGVEAMHKLFEYFDASLAERRKRPRDDMMTLLIQAEFVDEAGERSRLSDEELRSFFNLLATAGNETVTKLLASAFYWLWRFPDQRKVLLEEPDLMENAVEEILRFDPPSQYQGRVTTRDVEIHGKTIPRGAKLAIVNAASGRDERKYPNPDVFDVRRRFDLHLNLGYGQHICLGKSLARLESRIAHEEFLRRFPSYEVDESRLERMHSSNVRGLSALPLHY
ncbi:MAG: cytochrome P450 [Myxococcota bacterium]|nr:cytochrome P450 [Myxococcota bacterium]